MERSGFFWGIDNLVLHCVNNCDKVPDILVRLIEELRSALADRFVLSLINGRIVQGKDVQIKENGAVLIRDDACRAVISEWQMKKKETLLWPPGAEFSF